VTAIPSVLATTPVETVVGRNAFARSVTTVLMFPPAVIVVAGIDVKEKSCPTPARIANAVTGPEVGLMVIRSVSILAEAGIPANSVEPRANIAPKARPLRVVFLDMFYLSFLVCP
jgi:hypothetical protein